MLQHANEALVPRMPTRPGNNLNRSVTASDPLAARQRTGRSQFASNADCNAPHFRSNQGEVSEGTSILERLQQGDNNAAEALLPLVYEELRQLAARKLAHESPGQTLQPTALVHEAWLRLVGSTHQQWHGRKHFFAAAAEAMRRILIDNARRKARVRHGKGLTRVDLVDLDLATTTSDEILLQVNDAVQKLAAEDPAKAELVKLRFFVGLNISEAAAALGTSESTLKKRWDYCRAWLYDELTQGQ
jgi:RNA polymerase sigma factor (TIGR02999 family)